MAVPPDPSDLRIAVKRAKERNAARIPQVTPRRRALAAPRCARCRPGPSAYSTQKFTTWNTWPELVPVGESRCMYVTMPQS